MQMLLKQGCVASSLRSSLQKCHCGLQELVDFYEMMFVFPISPTTRPRYLAMRLTRWLSCLKEQLLALRELIVHHRLFRGSRIKQLIPTQIIDTIVRY